MKFMMRGIVCAVAATFAGSAFADVTIGVTVSATGPGAALGAPQKNTAVILPTTIGNEKVNWIVLDDATDPTNASKNVSKFISESKADIIIGSSTTANTAAMVDAAVEGKTPLIALAPNELPPEKDKWVFRMPQHNGVMAQALIDHMVANKVKTLGFIGFADVYGEQWLKVLAPLVEAAGIKLAVVERYNRTDTSVTGQIVKIISAAPDAVLVVAGGAPAVLPHTTLVERGYKGPIYQTHGAPSATFLKLGGKNVEGGIFVTGPIQVWDQLPDTAPTKKVSAQYVKLYEDKYGAGTLSPFGGYMWDAWALIENAVPMALKKAKPGTPEFRAALRDAIEQGKDVVGVHGVYTMSPTDHFGHDKRARVLMRVENGAFKLIDEKKK
jgi:branched-chain amino acid transport system substrate-binding protein